MGLTRSYGPAYPWRGSFGKKKWEEVSRNTAQRSGTKKEVGGDGTGRTGHASVPRTSSRNPDRLGKLFSRYPRKRSRPLPSRAFLGRSVSLEPVRARPCHFVAESLQSRRLSGAISLLAAELKWIILPCHARYKSSDINLERRGVRQYRHRAFPAASILAFLLPITTAVKNFKTTLAVRDLAVYRRGYI